MKAIKKTKEELKDLRLYQTYGLRLSKWKDILENQNGVCWICKSLPGSGRLCVDHVHVPGFKKMTPNEKVCYVRGLLCFLCNVGLKGFEKTKDPKINRQRLEGTYKYFQKFPLKGEI